MSGFIQHATNCLHLYMYILLHYQPEPFDDKGVNVGLKSLDFVIPVMRSENYMRNDFL